MDPYPKEIYKENTTLSSLTCNAPIDGYPPLHDLERYVGR